MIVREIVDPNGAVLVHRELESGGPGVRDTTVASCRGQLRHPAAKVYRIGADPEGKAGWRRDGQTPSLRSRPVERRSGRSSPEPYPPSTSSHIVPRVSTSHEHRVFARLGAST